ncbi:alkaline phosphatase family protein [Actinacidiphila epipremni]|uniref:Phospholipase n=1 Tax=Actinacidiphila epipremni TaxID=2053013 RepID=A0ABX0ZP07_9ACTN|nr:alkaline phosphatase family protein [Actinacidiphila epipremni]NJP44777.1 phospholipase [Actinacidiphila epipremni]
MSVSTGLAAFSGTELLARAAAAAPPGVRTRGANGIEHVVVLMMENRSFDHFLGWLPGADGRQDLVFPAPDGKLYPNYPLAPDFQGCGYSDPDHSWEGFLVQSHGGRMDGFLQRPTLAEPVPGLPPAAANTFPVGYYTNLDRHHRRKAVPDLPVLGALAEHYTVLDRYFCSFAGETFPNRFYQHAARTDRDHNSNTLSTMPTIWDQLSPIPNDQGIPTGGYFFRDSPFLALWGTKYFPFWHPFADGDTDALGIPVTTPSFLDTVASGQLPNVSFIDPAFDAEGNGTSADDHPFADIRLGERFIADTYHALADAGYLDKTVLVITYDEWGGFYDHVPPPRVRDDTDPADVDHTGDGTEPTEGRLQPDYRQLGFRVPTVVVSDRAPSKVVHHGPFEHASTLKMIESTFGLRALTARDAHAEDLGQVLQHTPRRPVPHGAIPRSSDVLGPVSDAAAICSAASTPSISPDPVGTHHDGHGHDHHHPGPVKPQVNGMNAFGRTLRAPHRH